MDKVYGIFKTVNEFDVLVIGAGVFDDYDAAERKMKKLGNQELFIRAVIHQREEK
ncbi:hypothetical protein WKH57_01340 [Niallia taxi]|uniref:hypothetical protein n=1 Tax=Niallia taxi TaxID=2499688 RepID=UPI0031741027